MKKWIICHEVYEGGYKAKMSATESLCSLAGIDLSKLSRHEILILEAEIFLQLYEELRTIYRDLNKDFFRLIKCSYQKEENMLEDNLARCVINDILSSEDYTLPGIARYTQMPEDVIYDIATGLNTSPSAKFICRIIELHRTVRKDIYAQIIKKITTEHSLAE